MKGRPRTIGIIGYGHLGRELALRLSRNAPRISVSRKGPDVQALPPGVTRADNLRVFEESEVIFLTVKPKVFPSVVEEVGSCGEGKVVVSLMAGIHEETLRSAWPSTGVVRAMTSLAFGMGAALSAVSPPHYSSDRDHAEVSRMLSAGGATVPLPSNSLNAFTAVYACGPGWIDALRYRGLSLEEILEAMREAIPRFRRIGLDPELLTDSIGRSYGALARDETLGNLFDKVATPGGMTAAGWKSLVSDLSRGVPLADALPECFRVAQRVADSVDAIVRAEVELHAGSPRRV